MVLKLKKKPVSSEKIGPSGTLVDELDISRLG